MLGKEMHTFDALRRVVINKPRGEFTPVPRMDCLCKGAFEYLYSQRRNKQIGSEESRDPIGHDL